MKKLLTAMLCAVLLVGETRLLCNPCGHAGYEQRVKEFDPAFGFDI
jgi:hypothetical protein